MENNLILAFKNQISIEKVLKELQLDYDIKDEYGYGIVDLFKETLITVNVTGSSYRNLKNREDNESRTA